jgi:regulatory protein
VTTPIQQAFREKELWSPDHSSFVSRMGAWMQQKITTLRYQQKNRRRVNVYLDNQYAFAVQETIAGTLHVGQELSEEQVAQLQGRDGAEAAYERVLNYLSYRPRSRVEVQAYLKRRRVPEDVVAALLRRLEAAGLLDDDAFARYWVENREAFRPRGVRSLRFELRRKGVPDPVAEGAMQDVNESESAYRAAQARAQRLTQLDYPTFRRRLDGFLQRRGFTYDVVKEVVQRLWRELHGSMDEQDLQQ